MATQSVKRKFQGYNLHAEVKRRSNILQGVGSEVGAGGSGIQTRTTTLPEGQLIVRTDRGAVHMFEKDTTEGKKPSDDAIVTFFIEWGRRAHASWMRTTDQDTLARRWIEMAVIATGNTIPRDTLAGVLLEAGFTTETVVISTDTKVEDYFPEDPGEPILPVDTSLEKLRIMIALTFLCLGKQFSKEHWRAYMKNRVTAVIGITCEPTYLQVEHYAHGPLTRTNAFLTAFDGVRICFFRWLKDFVRGNTQSDYLKSVFQMVFTLLRGHGLTHIMLITNYVVARAPYILNFASLRVEADKYTKCLVQLSGAGAEEWYEKIELKNNQHPNVPSRELPLLISIASKLAEAESSSFANYIQGSLTHQQIKKRDFILSIIEKVNELKDREAVKAISNEQDVINEEDFVRQIIEQSDNVVQAQDEGRAAPAQNQSREERGE